MIGKFTGPCLSPPIKTARALVALWIDYLLLLWPLISSHEFIVFPNSVQVELLTFSHYCVFGITRESRLLLAEVLYCGTVQHLDLMSSPYL